MNEDKAAKYHRLKRRASIASLVASAALLGGFIITGATLSLRTTAESLSSTAPVLAYVVLLSLINEAFGLPLAFYSGFLLERRYGLSNQTLAAWLVDQAKSLALGATLSGAAASIVYSVMRASPDRWWLYARDLRAADHRATNLARAAAADLLFDETVATRGTARATARAGGSRWCPGFGGV